MSSGLPPFDGDDDKPQTDAFDEFDDPLAREFLRHRSIRKGESSVENDETVLRQYLPHLGEKSVDEAEHKDVLSFANRLAEKGCTKSTIEVYLSTINSLHQHLNYNHHANLPDVSHIPSLFDDLESGEDRSDIDRDEVKMMIDAAEDLREAIVIGLLYFLGLRATELINLRLDHVDLEEGIIWVNTLKGDNDRTLPIHEDIRFTLKIWLEEERPSYPKSPASDRVIVGKETKHAHYQDIWEIVHEAADGADIQRVVGETAHDNNIYRVKPHVLRHSVSTHAFIDGMTREELAYFLGHENIDTVDTYIHTDDMEQAIQSYSNQFSGF